MNVKFAISKTNQPLILLEEGDIFNKVSFTEDSISLEDYLKHKNNLQESVNIGKVTITEIPVKDVLIYFTDLESFEYYNNNHQKPKPLEHITRFIAEVRK